MKQAIPSSIAATLVLFLVSGCGPLGLGGQHSQEPITPQHTLTIHADLASKPDKVVPIEVYYTIVDSTGQGGAHGTKEEPFGDIDVPNGLPVHAQTPYKHKITYAVGVDATVTVLVNYRGAIRGEIIRLYMVRDEGTTQETTVADTPNQTVPSGVLSTRLSVTFRTGHE